MESISDDEIISNINKENDIDLSDLEEEKHEVTQRPNLTQAAEYLSGERRRCFFRPELIVKCLHT